MSRDERRAQKQGFTGPAPAREAAGQTTSVAAAVVPVAGGALFSEDRSMRHKKNALLTALLVVLGLFSLFVDGGFGGLFNPIEVFTCYGIWFQQTFAQLFDTTSAVSVNDILANHASYFRILSRAGVTAMTIICGAVLAVAGSLYQSAFRNPIASPSMLGVSSAIQLGDVIMVLVFDVAASMHLGQRYLICYGCVIVVMAALFGASRLMTGKHRPLNVINLLLCAMIITQIIGVIITYVTMFIFTLEQWEAYNRLSEALTVDLTGLGWLSLFVTCIIGLVPVILLRFRLNGLNFDDTEMRLLGIDASRLRLFALICGTILLMGVQVQMGTVAMLALVVPHISRMVFGAEFRKQFWGNILIGASLLVLCRIVVGFVPFIGTFLPISVVLNFLVLPFFVWMLATQQRGWEQ